MVEQQLELAIWTIADEALTDRPPSTDKLQSSGLLDRLGGLASSHPDPDMRAVFQDCVAVGRDLFTIRHTVVHGRPLSYPRPSPRLARNVSWLGEIRKREATTLALTQEVLDRSAVIADGLFSTLGLASVVLASDDPSYAVVAERHDLIKAYRDEIAALGAALRVCPEG